MSEQTEGWSGQLARYGKAVIDKALLPAAEKLIPQGASELSQALFSGSAYMPYGPTNRPVSMESSGLYGEAAEPPASYEAELQKYVTLDPDKAQQLSLEAPSLDGPASEQAVSYESELQRYVSRAQETQQERGIER
ncbi:MAG: hypothetical protein LC104_17810 [Bacteroidales bacterium]|nr:hypothetical protein [Bacteroidales bacterium]